MSWAGAEAGVGSRSEERLGCRYQPARRLQEPSLAWTWADLDEVA